MSASVKALAGRLFIGGEWRPASGNSTFAVDDPGNGETITEVADGTVADGIAAVDAAAAAA
ncbi:MAG TPA: NAD-dependent succinate-semialdehyde dehydrogenase, partial [Propionibacterium sp.]|nr:NAD-dependent succinate-semialdehyde dehydrogenase [Propionibacterium sp.]